MPTSKAQQKATNKWIAKSYDRVNLTVPKGRKDEIKAHSECRGESVNGFINRAIDGQIARDSAGGHQEVTGGAKEGTGISLCQDALKTAQKAAERTGEALCEFVSRAVETQAKRDKSSLALGIDPITNGRGDKTTEREA